LKFISSDNDFNLKQFFTQIFLTLLKYEYIIQHPLVVVQNQEDQSC